MATESLAYHGLWVMSFVEDHGCHGLETWTFEASPITKLEQVELNISPFVRHVQFWLSSWMDGKKWSSESQVGLEYYLVFETELGGELYSESRSENQERWFPSWGLYPWYSKKKEFGGLAMVTSGTNHVVSCKYIWSQSSQIFVRTSFDVYLPTVWLPCPLIWFRTPPTHWTHRRFPDHYAIFLKRKKMTTTLKRLKFVRKWERTLC